MEEKVDDTPKGLPLKVEKDRGRVNIAPAPATNVFIAVASYDKRTFMICTQTLMNAIQVMMSNGIGFEFKAETGLPYVDMARNNLEAAFMNGQCDQMLFIDADVGIAPMDFLALVMAPEDVVAGVYPKKSDEEQFTVDLVIDEDKHPVYMDGAFEAKGAPTGAMKIRRHVLEKMRVAYEATHGYNDPLDGSPRYNFFGNYIIDRHWYGDDFGFCKLWRDIGGKVVVLPKMTMIHTGTKNYEGNFYDFLERRSMSPVVHSLATDGWMSMEELEWLHKIAAYMSSIAEIGSFKGRATIALAEGNPHGKVYAIDHWLGDDDGNKVLRGIYDKEDVFGVFMKNVGCYSNVEVMRMSSLEAAEKIESVDMAFIDGEHTYESVTADIKAWLPKTRKIIAGHDYDKAWPGVMQAVKELLGPVNVVGSIWWKEVGLINAQMGSPA